MIVTALYIIVTMLWFAYYIIRKNKIKDSELDQDTVWLMGILSFIFIVVYVSTGFAWLEEWLTGSIWWLAAVIALTASLFVTMVLYVVVMFGFGYVAGTIYERRKN